jgi:hypothetical protein
MTKPSRTYRKTGLYSLMAKVSTRGLTALDQRSAGARALLEWRRELENDLGGPDALSAQQRTIVELACRVRLYLDSVDGYLMTLPALVNKRKRTAFPILLQRMQLSDQLARLLAQLGLQRLQRPTKSLAQYIQDREKESAS